jgi:hypothetical protein
LATLYVYSLVGMVGSKPDDSTSLRGVAVSDVGAENQIVALEAEFELERKEHQRLKTLATTESTSDDQMSNKIDELKADLLRLARANAERAAQPLAPSSDDCVFQAGIDYTDPGLSDTSPQTGLNQKACCMHCRDTPGCKVGVISASYDDPPSACWLKASMSSPVKKAGVVSCSPGTPAAPPNIIAHETAVQALDVFKPAKKPLIVAKGEDVAVGRSGSAGKGKGEGEGGSTGSTGSTGSDPATMHRRDAVVKMMKHAWGNYKEGAWGYNEVDPVSGKHRAEGVIGDSKYGATIVDSLDTLYLMGLRTEYEEGVDWVAKNLDFSGSTAKLSVFETTIRYLGGLLGAYGLTGDPRLKTAAHALGKVLLIDCTINRLYY